ncbi:MAG: hypothetical protein ACREJM_01255, partial [Candidatus Saccharimonadales bacterium]
EVIITVVATGFDASYYKDRPKKSTAPAKRPDGSPVLANTNTTKQDEKALSEIDMNLDQDASKGHGFTDDHPMPNIWSINNDEDNEDNDEDDGSKADDEKTREIVASNLEDELDKPSFLRRLGGRRKKSKQPELEVVEEDESETSSASADDDKSEDGSGLFEAAKKAEAEKGGSKESKEPAESKSGTGDDSKPDEPDEGEAEAEAGEDSEKDSEKAKDKPSDDKKPGGGSDDED